MVMSKMMTVMVEHCGTPFSYQKVLKKVLEVDLKDSMTEEVWEQVSFDDDFV